MFEIETRERILKEINQFFQVEQGNRLTIYNMGAFSDRINTVLMECLEIPKPPGQTKREEKR